MPFATSFCKISRFDNAVTCSKVNSVSGPKTEHESSTILMKGLLFSTQKSIKNLRYIESIPVFSVSFTDTAFTNLVGFCLR